VTHIIGSVYYIAPCSTPEQGVFLGENEKYKAVAQPGNSYLMLSDGAGLRCTCHHRGSDSGALLLPRIERHIQPDSIMLLMTNAPPVNQKRTVAKRHRPHIYETSPPVNTPDSAAGMGWKFRRLAGAIIENAIRDCIDGDTQAANEARAWLASGGADIWLTALDIGAGDHITGAGILAALDSNRITTGGHMKIDGLGHGSL